jgi:DNA-binding PadR family transcriptional regulator
MSLSHALMTSLIEKPSSGYDLARRFDKSIGFFWHATHQQIYRELARMETAGWIASEAAPDGGKTRKRMYQVLNAGREELLRWVREPAPLTDPRDELIVRLRADASLGPLGLDVEIERRLQLHRAKLATYRAIEKKDFAPSSLSSREHQVLHLVLKTGLMYEEGWVRWCEEALATLRQWPAQVQPNGSPIPYHDQHHAPPKR